MFFYLFIFLIKDFVTALKKISEFFRLSLNVEQIHLVATQTSFNSMKEKSENTHGKLGDSFFRKGRSKSQNTRGVLILSYQKSWFYIWLEILSRLGNVMLLPQWHQCAMIGKKNLVNLSNRTISTSPTHSLLESLL